MICVPAQPNHGRRSSVTSGILAACLLILASARMAHAADPVAPESAKPSQAALLEERFVAGEALTLDVALDTGAFLKGGYPIDSAGFVEFPVVGKVPVAGKTRAEVEEFLSQKFANYLRDTHITAIPAIRLTLLGYWVRQGMYYVDPRSTVWDAVYSSGGIAGERTIDRIHVMRGSTVTTIPFLDEYSKGATVRQAGIRSGDLVVVPVPRDNSGFWYWFRETVAVTAEMAAVISTALSAYIVYESLND